MKTILVVDDSPTVVMSLTDILTKAGHRVEKAGHGVEALGRVKAGLKPDLVITDLNMPQMNGIELIRELRRLPALRFTPILILTTVSQEAKRQEGKGAGATGWLVKPVDGADLIRVIRQVLPGA